MSDNLVDQLLVLGNTRLTVYFNFKGHQIIIIAVTNILKFKGTINKTDRKRAQ